VFHVKEAGADAKLTQHGPLGVAYHSWHPISTLPIARITAHATVPGQNCVEQLTFSKTFVDQLQFEQLIFFCLKVKLLKIHVRQMIFDFRLVDKKSDICSNGVEQMKNCVNQFF